MFMICFSRYYMPTTCSLVELFNVSASHCTAAGTSDPSRKGSDSAGPGGVVDGERGVGSPLWLWLVWPIILCVGTAGDFVVDLYWTFYAVLCKYAGNCQAGVTQRGAPRLPTKLLLHFGQMFPALSFCTSVFVWFARHGGHVHDGAALTPYLEATAMVFLFGWTTNLIFFSGMTQKFCVFSLVLKEVITRSPAEGRREHSVS